MAGAAAPVAGPPLNFARAPFRSSFVDRLPPAAYEFVTPTPVASPRLIAWSDDVAKQLGLDRPIANDVAALAGNLIPSGARPYAARYGGHQFGHWAGQLGDGRAIGFGDLNGLEVQLKGAGPTPFSRRADGRAVLRSSVREFVCSEAMHALGVPTTRALALVSTGDGVTRDMLYDGNPRVEPGAIVTRVAPSFVRFGNFEIFAATGDVAGLRALLDDVVARFFPELAGPDAPVRLFGEVTRRTAALMVEWMTKGFVHGVMNTDNMSVLGLTIDYGPYGWLEEYEPLWTPNTTDMPGHRYGYARQPAIAEWNLAQFGSAIAHADEALIPALTEALKSFGPTFAELSRHAFAAKLGVASVEDADGRALFSEMDELMRLAGADFTLWYRALATPSFETLKATCYRAIDAELGQRLRAWVERFTARVRFEALPERARRMNAVNPLYVPRNWLLAEAIERAEAGDDSGVHRLMDVFRAPYDERSGLARFAGMRPEWARAKPGCSTLSCSS